MVVFDVLSLKGSLAKLYGNATLHRARRVDRITTRRIIVIND